ncbi:MAG: type III-B CRISPR module RAMP protein Cmr1 [bacterium]
MEYADITFRVRTPLFLGKHSEVYKDEKVKIIKGITYDVFLKKAKLDANPFRGLLRWWFRALHGWTEDMTSKESELFGSTDEASSFKIFVVNRTLDKSILKSDRGYCDYHERHRPKGQKPFGIYPLPNSPYTDHGNYDGLAYFSKNLYSREKNPNRINYHEYFDANGTNKFEIRIVAKKACVFRKILMLIWLAFQFSGIGNRSRRCFGNLEIESNQENLIPNFTFKNSFQDSTEYLKVLEDNFDQIERIFEIDLQTSKAKSIVPCLNNSDFLCSFQGFRTWQEAIEQAGTAMQLFRTKSEPDYSHIRNISSASISQRAAFGLPLLFRFSNPNTKVNLNMCFKKERFVNGQRIVSKDYTKLSSPAIASITKMGGNYFVQYLILYLKYEQLLDEQNEVFIEDENTGSRISVYNNALSQFVCHLENPQITNTAIDTSHGTIYPIKRYKFCNITNRII